MNALVDIGGTEAFISADITNKNRFNSNSWEAMANAGSRVFIS